MMGGESKPLRAVTGLSEHSHDWVDPSAQYSGAIVRVWMMARQVPFIPPANLLLLAVSVFVICQLA